MGDGRDGSNKSMQERLAEAQTAQVCGMVAWGSKSSVLLL
jgi:hypothetical protein